MRDRLRDKLLIIPYSDMTPEYCSEEFWEVLDRLLHLEYASIIFPFFFTSYVRHYDAIYIEHGKVSSIFGEDFAGDILGVVHGDENIVVYLFPYIYSSSCDKDKTNIVIDDEICDISHIRRKFGKNAIIIGCGRYLGDKKLIKRQKIIIQSLQKLLK